VNRPDDAQHLTSPTGPESRLRSVSLSRTRTWGGLDTQDVYTPDDATIVDYGRNLGDPGVYPYTRGSYPEMYRKRMWTLRHIVGYGTPEDTRAGIEEALASGTTGIDVVLDNLSQEAIDPDHPLFLNDVGLEGCSIACVADLERLLQGIDLTQVDIAWHSALLIHAMVAALALRHGLPLRELQGSHMPDHVGLGLAGWGQKLLPADLAHRASVDCLEYVSQNFPRWTCGFPQAYNLRERGLTPAGEIAVGLALVQQTLEDLADRGIAADDVAPRLAWVSTADIDLFEEVAKYRALRRMWSRTMKERFEARDPRSMRLRISCHTSGRSLTHAQPMNNVVRATVETLAAILGGVQAVETCAYDEPVTIPTPQARELAIRTQQVLAHEAGVARTADPLGGSFYVESLTNDIESRSQQMLQEIEAIGFLKAVESGWIDELMDRNEHAFHAEVRSGERVIVGVNVFETADDETPPRFNFDRTGLEQRTRQFEVWKAARERDGLRTSLARIHREARQGANPYEAMVDAFTRDATIGEVWGVFRTALGYPYDPFGVLESPLETGVA